MTSSCGRTKLVVRIGAELDMTSAGGRVAARAGRLVRRVTLGRRALGRLHVHEVGILAGALAGQTILALGVLLRLAVLFLLALLEVVVGFSGQVPVRGVSGPPGTLLRGGESWVAEER